MRIVVREHIKANGTTYAPGDVVPGALRWPALLLEIQLGKVMPEQDDGRPCRWVADATLGGGIRCGDPVPDAHLREDFHVLVATTGIVPVLVDDPPAAPPAPVPPVPPPAPQPPAPVLTFTHTTPKRRSAHAGA